MCFIDYAKDFDYVDHSKLWKILKKMGILDHLACLLRHLYAGQEAPIRTRCGMMDWLQTGKGVLYCILSPCLFNLYAEYIMQNAGLDEAQAGIKITGRNIITSDTQMIPPLIAESKEELNSLLMNVKKESEKADLKLNIQEMKIILSGPITAWKIDVKTMETVRDVIFFSATKSLRMVTAATAY